MLVMKKNHDKTTCVKKKSDKAERNLNAKKFVMKKPIDNKTK